MAYTYTPTPTAAGANIEPTRLGSSLQRSLQLPQLPRPSPLAPPSLHSTVPRPTISLGPTLKRLGGSGGSEGSGFQGMGVEDEGAGQVTQGEKEGKRRGRREEVLSLGGPSPVLPPEASEGVS